MMNLMMNPSADDVRRYCANMQESLLAAVEKGTPITLSDYHSSRPVDGAYGDDYGMSFVERVYTGTRYIIEYGEPASVSRAQHAFAAMQTDPPSDITEADFAPLFEGAEPVPCDAEAPQAERRACTCPLAVVMSSGCVYGGC